MADKDDGGPAHPVTQWVRKMYMDENGYGRERTVSEVVGGLTIRDWFAGQALANPTICGTGCWADNALYAYQMADAMLAALKQASSPEGSDGP